MNLFQRIRDRLRTVRLAATETAASPYWRAAQELARGKEPSGKPEAIAAAMEAAGKTENDLEVDAQLLMQLAAHEAVAATLDTARENSTRAGVQAAVADQKAQQLRDESVKLLQHAENLRHAASGAYQAAERAINEAANVRAKLAARGHTAAAEAVAANDEQNRQASLAHELEHKLAAARKELADAEQSQAELKARGAENRLPGEGHSRSSWVAQKRLEVAALERQLAELQPAPQQEPEPANA